MDFSSDVFSFFMVSPTAFMLSLLAPSLASARSLFLSISNNPIELLGLLLHGGAHDLHLVKLLDLVGSIRGSLGLGLLHLGKFQLHLNYFLALTEPCSLLFSST